MEWLEGRARDVCPRCGGIWYDSAKPCATVVVEDDQGRALLVKRGIQPFLGLWNLPGGFLEADEHPSLGARREVLEETGFEVDLLALIGLYVGFWDGEGDETRAHYSLNVAYRARIIGGAWMPNVESTEIRFVSPRGLPPETHIAYPNHWRALSDWSAGRTALWSV